MIAGRRFNPALVVVDAARDDYQTLTAQLDVDDEVVFFATGRDALRAPDGGDAFWLVSTQLPDMSGFDLYEMLRDRLVGTSVGIVAARYRPEEEIRAYQAGAVIFACKPLDAAWLRACLRSFSDNVVERSSP